MTGGGQPLVLGPMPASPCVRSGLLVTSDVSGTMISDARAIIAVVADRVRHGEVERGDAGDTEMGQEVRATKVFLMVGATRRLVAPYRDTGSRRLLL